MSYLVTLLLLTLPVFYNPEQARWSLLSLSSSQNPAEKLQRRNLPPAAALHTHTAR